MSESGSLSHSGSEEEKEDLSKVVKVEEDLPVISSEQMGDHFNRVQFDPLKFGPKEESSS